MQTNEKHRFHGIALAQIVEYEAFTALNSAPGNDFGHYRVNHDRELYVKYRTRPETGGSAPSDGQTYGFTISPEEAQRYRDSIEAAGNLFLALVCGQASVVLLKRDDIETLLSLPSGRQQWVEVTLSPNISPRVRGTKGPDKPLVVPHNSCPRLLFQR